MDEGTFKERARGDWRTTSHHNRDVPAWTTIILPSRYRSLCIIDKHRSRPLCVCVGKRKSGERVGGSQHQQHQHQHVVAGSSNECSCCHGLHPGSAGPGLVSPSWGLQPLLLQADAPAGTLIWSPATALPRCPRGPGLRSAPQPDLWHSSPLCLPRRPCRDCEGGRGGSGEETFFFCIIMISAEKSCLWIMSDVSGTTLFVELLSESPVQRSR